MRLTAACDRSVRAAKTVEEATELVSVSFEYVTDVEGLTLFKKRK